MKNLIMLFLVVAGAAVFVVFWDSPPEIFIRSKSETPAEELPKASSYMNNTVTRKFENDGTLAYILRSSQGRYFKTGDRFEMDRPALISRPASTESWHFQSLRVESVKAGGEIVMSGNVYAWQPLENGKNEFHTSEISYFPDTNEAKTSSLVNFTSPTGKTTARGMKADLENQVYLMLEDVKGYQYGQ